MADLIDRQAVWKTACKGCTSHGDNIGECYESEPCERLNTAFCCAPAGDAVEVVRCKDCIYWSSSENETEKWEYCKIHNINVGPHAFCFLGERREENV